jgi:hypothetical protein
LAAPDREERLLGDVFGELRIADDAVREGIRGPGMSLVKELEGFKLTAADQGHQLFVGQATDRSLAPDHHSNLRADRANGSIRSRGGQ